MILWDNVRDTYQIQWIIVLSDINIYIYINAVKRLITSKIKVFVYIIYVCVLCKYIHMHVYISENMLFLHIIEL